MFIEKFKLLQEILGKSEQSGEEYLFNCPLHEHHKPKLSINIHKNVGKCWVCGKSWPALRLLFKQFGTVEQINRWNTINKIVDLSEHKTAKIKQQIKLPKEFKTLVTKQYSEVDRQALEYLVSRNVTKQIVYKYKIGYCSSGEYRNRIIIPSFNRFGKLDYFVGRSYNSKQQPYLNPSNEHGLVFNELLIDWSKNVILTEGTFDAIFHDNCIPLLGSTLNEQSELFTSTIEHSDEIILALDPDADKKQKKIASLYKSYGITVYDIDVSGFKDLALMPDSIFQERLKNKTEYNYRSEFLSRLKRI